MAVASPLIHRALDSNGNPNSGAKLYFYDAGTVTERDVFSNVGLSLVIAQPLISNAAGWFDQVFIDGTAGNYKYRVTDSADVILHTDVDDVQPEVVGTVPLTQGGTGATTASAARTALSVPSVAQHDALDTRVGTAETAIANYIDQTVETLTWAASIEIDHASQSVFQVTLGGSTAFTITGLRNGGTFELLLIQDGTGSRAATFSGDYIFASSAPRINQTAGASTLIRGSVIGDKVYCKVQEAVPVLASAFGKEGGTPTTAVTTTWTTMPMDDGFFYDDGTLVGSGVSSSVFTLPAGEYRIIAMQSIDDTGDFALRLRDSADTTTFGQQGLAAVASNPERGNIAHLDTLRFTIAAQESFVVQYYAQSAGALGVTVTGDGFSNMHNMVTVERYS